MKKRIFSVLIALVLVCSFSLVTAVPAAAVDPAVPDRVTAITRTADRLVALQGTDYGWNWVVTDLTAHDGDTSYNLYGVTALGLIDAYEVTTAQSYLDAAGLVADMMIGYGTDYAAFKAAGLGQSFDLRFLMRYAEASNDTSYSDFAKAYWAWVKAREAPNVYADGSQEDFYQFYITIVSPGYAMWSCADFGLAAFAMGDTAWASAMAVVVTTHLAEITDTDDWRFIGWGHALEFLNTVDSAFYATEIGDLITNLKADQVDGSWPGTAAQGAVQNTAYAIMGLAVVGEAGAAQAGADWLVENQINVGTSTGGWIETDSIEYSENDSEALQALAATAAPVTIGTLGYYSIQSAIDAASSGDTISVTAGTYNENIVINEALTVKSTGGVAETIIKGVDNNDYYLVDIRHSDVTFDGFTVTHPTFEGTSDVSGIIVQSRGELVSNVHILDNIVTQVRSESGTASMFAATGINIGAGPLSDIVISGNTITDIKNPSQYTSSCGFDHTCGINVWNGAENIVIYNNTISDIKFNGIILECASDVLIENNPITDCQSGIRLEPREGDISNIRIEENSITGCKYGISVAPETFTLSGLTANFNNIAGNTEYGVANFDLALSVDATYNWWGRIGGPSGEGLGNGDNVTANVDYDPWLTENQAKTVSDGIAYFGSTIPLEPGWNTLSVPLKLKDNVDSAKSANTMAEIVGLGDFLISSDTAKNWEIAYQYNPAKTRWDNIGNIKPDIELVPGRGYYIKILGTETVDFPVLYSGELDLPALELSAGWNLIGSAFGIDKTDYGIAATDDVEDGQKPVATALYSIKDKCSVVVSPSTQGQVAAWGTTVIDDTNKMIVGEAYWVFMTAPATLAGFEVTPIYYLP